MVDRWFAVVSPEDGIRVLRDDSRLTIICEVPAAYTNEEAVKDARLIAAAPELLEVLIEAAETLERCRYSEKPMAAKCRSVIAKATGAPQ